MALERCIHLFGKEYLLIGDLQKGGAIATEEQYANAECSFAQLKSNGTIYRFGKVIGTRDDIEFLRIIDVEIKASCLDLLNAMSNMYLWSLPERLKDSDGKQKGKTIKFHRYDKLPKPCSNKL